MDCTNSESVGTEPADKRKGGASAAIMERTAHGYLHAAAGGGLVAAFVLLAYQLLMHSVGDPVTPFRIPASVMLGRRALLPAAPPEAVVPVGLLCHLMTGVVWGAVFGLGLSLSRSRWAAGGIVTLAMVFGSVVWLLDFYVFAPVFWPWLQPISSLRLFIGHVFFFGLPLGLWVASKS